MAQPVCPPGWVDKTAGVEIGEYLKPFPELYGIYVNSFKYLPIKGKRIYVVPFMEGEHSHNASAVVCRDPDDDSVYYVSFREHPPDEETLAHELIHVAGGDELPAYNYSMFLLYAIERGLPPFNLLSLLGVDLETINRALRAIGFTDVEDYLNVRGIVPLNIAEIDILAGRVRVKRDVPEHVIVQTFLAELAGALSVWYSFGGDKCELLDCVVFEKIVKTERVGGWSDEAQGFQG